MTNFVMSAVLSFVSGRLESMMMMLRYDTIYTVCGKKRPLLFLHNFNKCCSQQPKMKECDFVEFIQRKNRIHSVHRDKMSKYRLLKLIMGGVGQSKQF